jgi:hypothetical protein
VLPSPLTAVDDMRSVAKWTLAAEGAVGAALISGGPLLAIGQVHGALHAVIAGLGLLAALGGVGIAIWSTTKVLTPRLTTPATLASPALARFREIVEESPEQFFGVVATNVASLLRYQQIAVKLARPAWSLDRAPRSCAGRLGNTLFAMAGQRSKRAEDGRAVSGLGALEGDERDHQEGDGWGEDAGQDGDRGNDGSHKKPFRGRPWRSSHGGGDSRRALKRNLACAGAHAQATADSRRGPGPGRGASGSGGPTR